MVHGELKQGHRQYRENENKDMDGTVYGELKQGYTWYVGN